MKKEKEKQEINEPTIGSQINEVSEESITSDGDETENTEVSQALTSSRIPLPDRAKEFFLKSFRSVPGIIICAAIAVAAWYLGQLVPIVGGPVFAILIGLLTALFLPRKHFESGIKFTSKKVLQWAVIFLGFGMNLFEIFKVGGESISIIAATISTSLVISFILYKLLKIPSKTAVLVGVGSSICGGSAIAATAPVIGADDEDIARSISVIFLFNILAALIFPYLGEALGMSDIGFGMWAGTAINDTSSVVAAGQTWSASHGSDVALNYATIVKLTRTLAIIPITLVLTVHRAVKAKKSGNIGGNKVNFAKIFPWFILFFVLAAIFNTFLSIPPSAVETLTTASKFMITMAMAAIGLNTNIVKLVKSGGKPILQGATCWVAIAGVSLLMQWGLGIW